MRKVIEVTRETEHRHLQPRRVSDLSLQEKSRKFDALMRDCEFQMQHFSELYKLTGNDYYLGCSHGFMRVLWYAGKAECEKVGGEKLKPCTCEIGLLPCQEHGWSR